MQLIIEYKQSELKTNFEDVKDAVKGEVNRYASMEVTEEKVPEAKKTMANLNKVKTKVSSQYKEYIEKLSAPINQLKSEKKELENIITEARESIKAKVAEFEAKRLKIAEMAIDEYLDFLLDNVKNIKINKEIIQTKDLIKLTAITPSGSLAKATRDAIDNRVSLAENELLKAKIEAEEKAKRDREIAQKARIEAEERARQREFQIQRENEERLRLERERAEREKDEAIKKAKQEALKEKLPENVATIEKVKPKKSADGKIIYTVLATFEVKAPKGLPDETIVSALKKRLEGAGITTLKSVEVMR